MAGLGASSGSRGKPREPCPSHTTGATGSISWSAQEVWRLRLEGIHYLGKRQVLSLTISQNPSMWPLCLQRFSTAHLLQQPPTCAEGSTCIMQQVLPPSALDGFSTSFRKEQFIWKGSTSLEQQGSAMWAVDASRGSKRRCKAWPGLQKKTSEISSPLFQAPVAPWGCCCAQGEDTGFTPSSWPHQGNALSINIWGRKMDVNIETRVVWQIL